MKRMHIHVSVERLDQAITFYSALFGEQPDKTKPDYARWTLDDPRLNFAISTRGQNTGVDHLGIQVEEEAELNELRARLKQADLSMFDEGETMCCYARSDKSWLTDPAGIAWEAYQTMDEVQYFASHEDIGEQAAGVLPSAVVPAEAPVAQSSGCCG